MLQDNENAGARMLAGVTLKNSITVTSYNADNTLWASFSQESKTTIKNNVMTALGNSSKQVRNISSSVISHIAAIELPLNTWPELINVLYANYNNQDLQVRMACIQTTG
mmetsp:Transcript_2002/g.3957  ORF Transcript_2002/g.3957 Transcript_2002/m.3957 type:complete len:109 (-) Transcript_2002:924-1250(-)